MPLKMALNMQSTLQIMAIIRFVSPLLLGVLLSRTIGKGHSFVLYEACMLHGITSSFAFQWALPQLMLTRKSTASNNIYAFLSFCSGLIAVLFSVLLVVYDSQLTPTTEYQWPIALWVFCGLASTTLEYQWILDGKYRLAVLSTFGTYFLSGLIVFILLNFTATIPVILWALTFIQLARVIVFFLTKNVWRNLLPRFNSDIQLSLSTYLTIAITFFISGSSMLIDGYIVKYWLSDDDFLFFRLGAREMPISQLLASTFSLLFAFRIASITDSTSRHQTLLFITQRTTQYFHWSFLGSIFIIIASHWLVKWVYSPEFSPMTGLLDTFMLVTIVRVLLPQSALNAVGLEKQVLYVGIAEWMIHLAASLWLVQSMGIMGIGWATLIAYTFEKLALIILSHRAGFPIRKMAPMRLWSFYSLLLILFYGMKYFY
jgi:O-antigen/teichoic acid export membrane protein